jgi:hypothetical protein
MASKRERQEKKLQASRERKELAHAKQLQEEALREQEKIRNQQRLEELRQIQEKERLTAIRQQFPTFVYKGEADSQFVERVKKITESFDFDSLPDVLRDWYAQIKADPYFLKEFASYDGGANPRVLHYMFHMGEYIYSSLGDEIKRWVPFNDLRVIPTGKSIVIKFGSLKKVHGGVRVTLFRIRANGGGVNCVLLYADFPLECPYCPPLRACAFRGKAECSCRQHTYIPR